jgi:hypothetical protein
LALQRALNERTAKPLQRKPNATGLPDRLKAGVESLSGLAMDDVRVHYNSPKPAAVQAHAYAQGTEIHVAPGQAQHLPHEAWHVVQQKEGRVKPTLQMKGIAINDDTGLEREADVMGARASMFGEAARPTARGASVPSDTDRATVIQMKGWRWTGKDWEELDKKEAGPKPSVKATKDAPEYGENSIYDTELDGFHKDEKDYYRYWESRNKNQLKSEPFNEPAGLPDVPPAAKAGAAAAKKLQGFLDNGILTPQKLGAHATTSGDKVVRPDQISINTLPASSDAETAKKQADYAVNYPAGGALPVAIEQHGDEHTENIDADAERLSALSSRARESALAIIRPDDLSADHKKTIQDKLVGGGSGETTLTGPISSANFIKVLVPAQFKSLFPNAAKARIQFVGEKKQKVAYNIIGESTRQVLIDVPDYQSALEAILKANPKSVFLTHVIRLGQPNPLKQKPASSIVAPAHPAAGSTQGDAKSAGAAAEVDTKSAVPATMGGAASGAGSLAAVWPALEAQFKASERALARLADELLDQILPEAIDAENKVRRELRLSYHGKDPVSGKTVFIANPRVYS